MGSLPPAYSLGSGNGGGGSGESNTASNVGSGSQVFQQKVDADLQFRTVVGGTNIEVVQGSDTLTVNNSASPGETNTASNVGGANQVFKQKSGADLEFRTILAGAGIDVSQSADTLTIANTASSPTFDYVEGTLNGISSPIVGSGTLWFIDIGTLKQNIGGGWSGDTFTAPHTGYYAPSFSGRVQYFGAGVAVWYIAVEDGNVNARKYGIVHAPVTAGIDTVTIVSAPVLLQAGETLSFALDNTSTSSVTILNDSDSTIVINEVSRL